MRWSADKNGEWRLNEDKSIDQIIRGAPGEIDVSLDETPTSGYRWSLSESSPGVALVAVATELDRTPAPVAGGAAQRRFRFLAEWEGTYDLVFQLKRDWEAKPMRVHRTRLVITPGGGRGEVN